MLRPVNTFIATLGTYELNQEGRHGGINLGVEFRTDNKNVNACVIIEAKLQMLISGYIIDQLPEFCAGRRLHHVLTFFKHLYQANPLKKFQNLTRELALHNS